MRGRPGPELELVEDFAIALRYANGSVASVTYASGGHPSSPKERIEVLSKGHSVVIDDFSSLVVDGRAERLGGQDKGHRPSSPTSTGPSPPVATSGCPSTPWPPRGPRWRPLPALA